MREIKFRFIYSNGKDSFTKEFSLNEIMNGDPFEVLSDMPMYRDYKMLDCRFQYTGLKDKNGVEIYEGDITRAYHFTDNDNKIHYVHHKIEWSDKFNGWFARNVDDIGDGGGSIQLWVYAKDDFEIIGNEHSNPELLEAK